MRTNYQIIFVDIDWTILNHNYRPGRFDMPSIRKLKRLQKKGIKVFICTARPYHSVDQIHFFDLFTPDGMILSNGGYIIYDDNVIYKTDMAIKDFEALCNLANKHKVNVEGIRIYDCFLINNYFDEVLKLFATYPESVPPVEDFHGQRVNGATLFAPKELDEIFQKTLKNHVYYYRYHDSGVDIASQIHDKGFAVKFVLDYLGIKKEEAISIGDDLQDISMFKETGLSIAMGNGKDETKENASYVTSDISHHGVKRALNKFIR